MFIVLNIRPGCLRPIIALRVQNLGLKHQSFSHSVLKILLTNLTAVIKHIWKTLEVYLAWCLVLE